MNGDSSVNGTKTKSNHLLEMWTMLTNRDSVLTIEVIIEMMVAIMVVMMFVMMVMTGIRIYFIQYRFEVILLNL